MSLLQLWGISLDPIVLKYLKWFQVKRFSYHDCSYIQLEYTQCSVLMTCHFLMIYFWFILCKYTNWSYACFKMTHRIYTTTVKLLYNTIYHSTIRHKACQWDVHGPMIWFILIYFPTTQVEHSFRRNFIQAHLVTQLGAFCSVIFRQKLQVECSFSIHINENFKVQYSPSIHLHRMSKSNAHLVHTFMKSSKSNTHPVFTYIESLSPMLI